MIIMNKKYIKKIIFLISIILFVALFINCYCSTYVKYASDYSARDMLGAQKIILGINPITKESLDKYDMNCDGKITSTDVDIMQQMCIGIYDSYVVKNKRCIAIKYIHH